MKPLTCLGPRLKTQAEDLAVASQRIIDVARHVTVHIHAVMIAAAMRISTRWDDKDGWANAQEHPRQGVVIACYPPHCPHKALPPTELRRCTRDLPSSKPNDAGRAVALTSHLCSMTVYGCDQGTSWLELYLGYIVRHGTCTFDSLTLRQPTVYADVMSFRRLVLRLARDALHPEVAPLLAPTAKPVARLKGIGITSTVACVRCIPDWSHERWMEVLRRLFMLKGLDAHAMTHFHAGTLCLRRARLLLNKECSLDRQSPVDCGSPQDGWRGLCQGCGSPIHFDRRPMLADGQWPRFRCHACKRQLRTGRLPCAACGLRCAQCRCGTGQRTIAHYLK